MTFFIVMKHIHGIQSKILVRGSQVMSPRKFGRTRDIQQKVKRLKKSWPPTLHVTTGYNALNNEKLKKLESQDQYPFVMTGYNTRFSGPEILEAVFCGCIQDLSFHKIKTSMKGMAIKCTGTLVYINEQYSLLQCSAKNVVTMHYVQNWAT